MMALVALVVVVVLLVVAVRHHPAAVETAAPSSPLAAPATPQTTPTPPLIGPDGFAPLQSQAVKDAIHRALATGATQRWQDGKLGGYAVPSLTTGANGCRAVRYTIDQMPDASYGSITACDASAR